MSAHVLNLFVDLLISDGLDNFICRKIFIFAERDLREGCKRQREDEIFALLVGDDIGFVFGYGHQIQHAQSLTRGLLQQNFARLVNNRVFAYALFKDDLRDFALAKTGNAHAVGKHFDGAFNRLGKFRRVLRDGQLDVVVVYLFLGEFQNFNLLVRYAMRHLY